MPADTVVLSPDRFSSLLISATRYALGRSSYVVAETVDVIVQHASRLDERTRGVLVRDIRQRPAGMECDEREWRRALAALEAALPEEDRPVDPRRDRWVTWTTASPNGTDDRHRGVFVAEHRGMADVVEDDGSPYCIPIGNLTFEEDRRG